ncbi:MAG TPA: ATP-binding cassette domain-containing protein, partial [bacterium]
GMKKAERKTRMAEVLKLVELDGRENDLVEDYSGGMQRRLEIARGLMHFPKVLFLDEPTLGLDTQTRRRIWNYIQQMNRSSGTTVVLTTHYMEEADVLCGRVGIMDKGVIVALDSPASLKNLIGADVLELETDGGDCGAFDGLDFVKKTVKHQNRISLSVVNGERKIPSLLEFARDRGISVRSVELHRPSLEDVFLHYTGSTIQERDASPADALPGRER